MQQGKQDLVSVQAPRIAVSHANDSPRTHASAWSTTAWTVLLVALTFLSATASAVRAQGDQAQSATTVASNAASPEASAKQVVQGAIERALHILRDQKLKNDSAGRMKMLRAAVDPVFDWQAMARSSIGPNWRKLDDAQRTEFVEVFKELLARQYMDDIDRFQGSEELRITGSEQRGEQVIVRTVLITASREEVPIDYTMHSPQSRFVVEDISIEGVSMVNHYRKTFSRFLVNSDFPSLLQRLKRKLGTS